MRCARCNQSLKRCNLAVSDLAFMPVGLSQAACTCSTRYFPASKGEKKNLWKRKSHLGVSNIIMRLHPSMLTLWRKSVFQLTAYANTVSCLCQKYPIVNHTFFWAEYHAIFVPISLSDLCDQFSRTPTPSTAGWCCSARSGRRGGENFAYSDTLYYLCNWRKVWKPGSFHHAANLFSRYVELSLLFRY